MVGANVAGTAVDDTGDLVVGVVGVLGGNGTGRADTAEEEDEGEKDEADDDELASSRVADAVVGPGALAVAHVLLDLVGAKLVVDETAEGDAVAEELEGRDGVAENHHGGDNEEDILQDTAEGHDETGSLADLLRVLAELCIYQMNSRLPRTQRKR